MPDLSGIPAVDVVIGLAFVFFLLSLVISSVTEAISSVLQLRWKTLRHGLRELFEDGSEEGAALWAKFQDDPRLRALWKETGFLGKRGPSYLPPRTFALTLLDTLAPVAAEAAPAEGDPAAAAAEGAPAEVDPAAAAARADQLRESHDAVARAKIAAGSVKNPLLQRWLLDALADVEADREKVLTSLEASFDSVTNRISGWYKRYASIIVAACAVALAVGLNVDSYAIGTQLWKDDAVRAAIAAQAGNLTDPETCKEPATSEDDGTGGDATEPDPIENAQSAIEEAAKCVSRLQALGLPLGWGEENQPDDARGWVAKSFGLLITVFALMLGAPFWFDTLSKLARLRATGKPEGTATTDDKNKPRQ